MFLFFLARQGSVKEWSKYDNLGHLKKLIHVQGGIPLGPKHPFGQGGVQEAVFKEGPK